MLRRSRRRGKQFPQGRRRIGALHQLFADQKSIESGVPQLCQVFVRSAGRIR